jgi:hypothetical protein
MRKKCNTTRGLFFIEKPKFRFIDVEDGEKVHKKFGFLFKE